MAIEQFHEFYKLIYGDRWDALKTALSRPELQVARWNKFLGNDEVRSSRAQQIGISDNQWDAQLQSYWLKADQKVIPEKMGDVLDFYVLDPASVFAARALGVQNDDRVLDMCAAPGGKTLVLAEELIHSGEIIANDVSESRRDRLKRVIQNYISRDVRERVWVQGKDAVQFGLKMKGRFDKVLLDAPCSGERHVLEDPKAQSEWSPKRPKGLAQRQFSLISAACLALAEGGRLLYSTCSLNPAENDGVVSKILERRSDEIETVHLNPVAIHPSAEVTDHGIQFLPDRCQFGPLYFSLLQKKAMG